MRSDRHPRTGESERRRAYTNRRMLSGLRAAALVCVMLLPGACFGQSASQAKLYDVDATGGDIRLILEALAQRSGVNIVVSPQVSGEVSAHLKQMPIESILDYLAAVHGFGWKKDGDTYLIANKDKLQPPAAAQPPETRPATETFVWRCRYIKPSDLARLISSIIPGCKAVQGPAMLSPVLATGQSRLGGPSAAVSSSGGPSGGDADKSATVVICGSPADIAAASDLLMKIDVRRPQVAIDVAITEIGSSSDSELGLEWSWNDLVLQEAPLASGGIRFGKFTKQTMTFTAAISAMIQDGSAKLLAQPNISVVDNEYAEILIGERILFPKLAGYTENGIPFYDKDEERVGIYLQIAPRIAGDDEVILTLYPQVSLVTSYLKTQAGDYPQISTREARTTVCVRDGSTIAIGGLLRDDEIKEGSKIPVLGDLPIIGGLFKRSKTVKERTEIVIFLTPRIIKEM